MKKTFISIFAAFLILLPLASCATTGASVSATEISEDSTFRVPLPEPEYELYSGQIMDYYWENFYNTENANYISKIIKYTNTECKLEKEINAKLDEISEDPDAVYIIQYLTGNFVNGKVVFEYDPELLMSFALKDESKSPYVKYLYNEYLSNELLIRAIMKSTAFWSLGSNAEQYPYVKELIERELPYVQPRVAATFNVFYGLDNTVPLIVGDNGSAEYHGEEFDFIVFLVSDIEATVKNWDETPFTELPEISVSKKVTAEESTIAPFIVYSLNYRNNKPVYFDFVVIGADGNPTDNKISDLMLRDYRDERPGVLYRYLQYLMFQFDYTNEQNDRTCWMRITVYTEDENLCAFELPFTVQK